MNWESRVGGSYPACVNGGKEFHRVLQSGGYFHPAVQVDPIRLAKCEKPGDVLSIQTTGENPWMGKMHVSQLLYIQTFSRSSGADI